MKHKVLIIFLTLIVTLAAITAAFADDGALVRKSMSHESRPTVRGYIDEAEHAFIKMMKFYVPSQRSDGTVEAIDYYRVDETTLEGTHATAKPLIGAYLYGPSEGVEGTGFVGHGRRDAYAAISLDDGETWKHTNLSESADLSSSSVIRKDISLFKTTRYAYPGDVVNIFHAVAGNRVLVAWPSRYCAGGQPSYALGALDVAMGSADASVRLTAVAAELGIDFSTESPDDLYLLDMYGVAGHQGSVDYTEDKFEQNHAVGEVPYSCLWAARGVLVYDETLGQSHIRWFAPERLTSGVRDVNRIETKCVAGAGCAITWQEDPEGLRPGQGEGPGEGWSGAIANHQTDVWYSYIPWGKFDLVQDPTIEDGGTLMTFEDYTTLALSDASVTQKPKPFIPFAMPMRMTDNARCNVDNPLPYCNGSIIDSDDLPDPLAYGLQDLCAATIPIATGPDDIVSDICVTADGLPLVGNMAATRPRLGLFGYDADGAYTADLPPVTDSAFVVVVSEESKGLGEFGFTDTGASCDPEVDEGCIPFDEGKNIWYYSFSMSLTDTFSEAAANGDGDLRAADALLTNLTSHGNMLNQPEVDWTTGTFYELANTVAFWDFGEYNFDLYNTEIARRGSLLAQDITKVHENFSLAEGGLVALPAWKQGIVKQGGPADVMVRRILIPEAWTPAAGNPYAFRNMACETWAEFTDGFNPFYPDGLCLDPAINLSATVPDECVDSPTGACPTVNDSGIGDTDPILQGSDVEVPNTTKVLTWHQCPAEFTSDSSEAVTCAADESTLDDQSWYNPLDVAKGHRGYLDGDFVMLLYAWSPNWRLNTVGHDRYELYIRRSFDGAVTWTTQPADYTHWDGTAFGGSGTTACETFRDDEATIVCYDYGAGANEQARNVTQLKSMKFTTLDPRYAPTAGSIIWDADNSFGVQSDWVDEDVRDPSRYFIVYETGDNTTTADGEPEPLDLFYSRAVAFGDHYQVWAEEDDTTTCYPSDPLGDDSVPADLVGSGFCNEFDQLEQGIPGLEASESSLAANPGGEFLYGAWSQIDHETGESDAMARRVWYIDGYIPAVDDDSGGGGGGKGKPK